MRFNLSVTGLPTSNWVVNKSGTYLGIGFGHNQMISTDLVACMIVWSNKTTDSFMCMDAWSDANRNVVINETQDISGVTTVT